MKPSLPPNATVEGIAQLEGIAADVVSRALALSEFAESLSSQEAKMMRAWLRIIDGEIFAIAHLPGPKLRREGPRANAVAT